VYDVPVLRRKHAHPWLISRQSGLAMYYRRPRRVAYYSDAPNDSSFRFRAYAMATALNEADIDVSASLFYRADRQILDDVFTHADVVVVHRSEYAAELDHLIGLARRMCIPVFFGRVEVQLQEVLASVDQSLLELALELLARCEPDLHSTEGTADRGTLVFDHLGHDEDDHVRCRLQVRQRRKFFSDQLHDALQARRLVGRFDCLLEVLVRDDALYASVRDESATERPGFIAARKVGEAQHIIGLPLVAEASRNTPTTMLHVGRKRLDAHASSNDANPDDALCALIRLVRSKAFHARLRVNGHTPASKDQPRFLNEEGIERRFGLLNQNVHHRPLWPGMTLALSVPTFHRCPPLVRRPRLHQCQPRRHP